MTGLAGFEAATASLAQSIQTLGSDSLWLIVPVLAFDFIQGMTAAYFQFLSAIAWPLAVVAIALSMKKHIERLLSRLQKLIGLGGEAHFFGEADAAAAAAVEVASINQTSVGDQTDIPSEPTIPDVNTAHTGDEGELKAARPEISQKLIDAMRRQNARHSYSQVPLPLSSRQIAGHFTDQMSSLKRQIFRVAIEMKVAKAPISSRDFEWIVPALDAYFDARGTLTDLYRVLDGMTKEARAHGAGITLENLMTFDDTVNAFLTTLHRHLLLHQAGGGALEREADLAEPTNS